MSSRRVGPWVLLPVLAVFAAVVGACGPVAVHPPAVAVVTPVGLGPASPSGHRTATAARRAGESIGGPVGSPLLSTPYLRGAIGYDLASPQCPRPRVPPGAGLSVVGANGGRAFTPNPCLPDEWNLSTGPRSLYVNSGMNPANYQKAPPGCDVLGARVVASKAESRAYAIGCAEAVYTLDEIVGDGVGAPLMWWIDVESSNSWDPVHLALNRYALQGEMDQLTSRGWSVGLYSTPKQWAIVTGGWSAPSAAADWLAPGPAGCGGRGFSGAPTWLVQSGAAWPSPWNLDRDVAC